MEAEKEEEGLDLPMTSNRDVSLVDHYILDLSCDMNSKKFIGSITLFMKPGPKSKPLNPLGTPDNEAPTSDLSCLNADPHTCRNQSLDGNIDEKKGEISEKIKTIAEKRKASDTEESPGGPASFGLVKKMLIENEMKGVEPVPVWDEGPSSPISEESRGGPGLIKNLLIHNEMKGVESVPVLFKEQSSNISEESVAGPDLVKKLSIENEMKGVEPVSVEEPSSQILEESSGDPGLIKKLSIENAMKSIEPVPVSVEKPSSQILEKIPGGPGLVKKLLIKNEKKSVEPVPVSVKGPSSKISEESPSAPAGNGLVKNLIENEMKGVEPVPVLGEEPSFKISEESPSAPAGPGLVKKLLIHNEMKRVEPVPVLGEEPSFKISEESPSAPAGPGLVKKLSIQNKMKGVEPVPVLGEEPSFKISEESPSAPAGPGLVKKLSIQNKMKGVEPVPVLGEEPSFKISEESPSAPAGPGLVKKLLIHNEMKRVEPVPVLGEEPSFKISEESPSAPAGPGLVKKLSIQNKMKGVEPVPVLGEEPSFKISEESPSAPAGPGLVKKLSIQNKMKGVEPVSVKGPSSKISSRSSDPEFFKDTSPHSPLPHIPPPSRLDSDFILVFDSCDIHVSKVSFIELPRCDETCAEFGFSGDLDSSGKTEESLRTASLQPGRALRFSTTEWSLNIWDEQRKLGWIQQSYPFALRVEYSTHAQGKSLKWVKDQDGNMTAFTRGDFINNRSLFPSQDHPETLSTWQAYITVAKPNIVLMTGDKEAQVTEKENGLVQFYYQSTMLMPSSTVAIAIGQWLSWTIFDCQPFNNKKWIPEFCSQMHDCCSVNFSLQPTLPCRVFAPKSLLSRASAEFQDYLPRCLSEMHNILGPHPFQRLDVLIVPSCFESLGMANPCLIFLSESTLVGNRSFCCRLSHEVSHSWFGLVLGPKDWTEEWMTEGFASFIEDLVHPIVMGMSEKDATEYFELRSLIKYRVLTAELSHTDEELQVMRINESDILTSRPDENSFVKNGLNPDKKCLQVHYLKGYFLLRLLSQKVGLSSFKEFLRKYVQRFHGQLVTSQDFLNLLFKEFPQLREKDCLNERLICREWLDQPGLPRELESFEPNREMEMIHDVYKQFEDINNGLPSLSRLKKKLICEDQITLLLELLLDVPCQKSVLEELYREYNISKSNPDVRHRWCELVIKHKLTKFYKDIKLFLLHDQAMGIYLFGELMLSNSTKQKQLAEECFHLLKDNMDDRLKLSVEELIFR